jgi:dinuclear metal center YbgI/SA1388 family protein
MNRDELRDLLHGELNVDAFKDGQWNGLQIEGKPEVEKVALAVSVSAETIQAAVDWGADALLTHHGLLWGHEPGHLSGVKRARMAAMLAAELNLYTYHLPIDAHPVHGNNAGLAEAAGCQNVRAGFDYKGNQIGMIGEVNAEAHDWMEKFVDNLQEGVETLTGDIAWYDFGPETIRTVGFVSGAAPYQVQDAIDAGLDAYVTGETTEPIYHLCKEAGIHFIAAGHYLSERFGVQRLGAWLAAEHGLEVEFFDVDCPA